VSTPKDRLVVFVGVGALGSHAVQLCRTLGCLVRAVDFDRVEQKNVLAQFYGLPSVGKLKTEALRQQMLFLFGTKVESVPHRLTRDNTVQLLGEADLVVDCLDNTDHAAGRHLVQDFVRRAGVPCVHGALAANGAYGRVVWDEHFTIDEGGQRVTVAELTERDVGQLFVFEARSYGRVELKYLGGRKFASDLDGHKTEVEQQSADVLVRAGAGAPTCEGGEHLPFVAEVAALLARSIQVFLASGQRRGFEVSPAGVVAT